MTIQTQKPNQLTPQNGSLMQMQVGRGGLVLQSFSDMWSLAQCIHRSGMAPKSMNKPEQVLVALQWGAELGIGPMQALSAIAVINGRPAIWGDLVVAMVRRSPQCEWIHDEWHGEGEKRTATCKVKRRGQPEESRSFSYGDAKRAGLLGRDTYKQYLDRMLQCRARAWAIRDVFADLLMGLSVAEEAADEAYIEVAAPELESGQDAPLNSLDDAAELLAADDAEFEPKPSEPTVEELRDWEREQHAERYVHSDQQEIPF